MQFYWRRVVETVKRKFATVKSKLRVATLQLQYCYSDSNALQKE